MQQGEISYRLSLLQLSPNCLRSPIFVLFIHFSRPFSSPTHTLPTLVFFLTVSIHLSSFTSFSFNFHLHNCFYCFRSFSPRHMSKPSRTIFTYQTHYRYNTTMILPLTIIFVSYSVSCSCYSAHPSMRVSE